MTRLHGMSGHNRTWGLGLYQSIVRENNGEYYLRR
jgi:hypothetical protein